MKEEGGILGVKIPNSIRSLDTVISRTLAAYEETAMAAKARIAFVRRKRFH